LEGLTGGRKKLLLLIILRRIWVEIIEVRIIKEGSTAIARSLLGDLSNRGNRPDLLEGFKGVNNKRINKRDVYLMVLMVLMVLSILTPQSFNIKEGWFVLRSGVKRGTI
jgi:hypothetical protein